MVVIMKVLRAASSLFLVWFLAGQPSAIAGKHRHHHDMNPSVDDSGGQKVQIHGALWQFQQQLKAAFGMPLESQKAFLTIMGAGLTAGGKMKCNIFGGVPACSDVDALRDTCSGMNHNIDCALLSAAGHAGSDPRAVMRNVVQKQGLEPCDTCGDALHSFWCAQSAPTCGTFDNMVNELLPAVKSVVLGEKRPNEAFSVAVPKLLQAASLGLPCREMCDSITASCGCGRPTTFGKMMTALHEKAPAVEQAGGLYATNMSLATSREVFAGVWDRPVCELFALSTMPGFSGACEKSSGLSKCTWCDKDGRPDFMEEQIVAQMAQSISGMMQAGMERLFDSSDPKRLGSTTVDKMFDWNDQGTQTTPQVRDMMPHKHASAWPWVFISGCLLAILIMGAIVVIRVKQERLRSVPYAHLDMDSGLDGIRYNPPVL